MNELTREVIAKFSETQRKMMTERTYGVTQTENCILLMAPVMFDEIQRLTAENARLKLANKKIETDLRYVERQWRTTQEQRDKIIKENQELSEIGYQLELRFNKLRETLEYYGNAENYNFKSITLSCGCCSDTEDPVILDDRGRKAREALEAVKEKA